MNRLSELPKGAFWPHLLDAIRRDVYAQFGGVLAVRQDEVKRGVSTPELAATLLNEYASGLCMSLDIVGVEHDLPRMMAEAVRSIDPNFMLNTTRRWKGASIIYTEQKWTLKNCLPLKNLAQIVRSERREGSRWQRAVWMTLSAHCFLLIRRFFSATRQPTRAVLKTERKGSISLQAVNPIVWEQWLGCMQITN
ncbi:hypothetical protein Q5E86_17725 [Providencia sp. CRE-138-0111]|nr:MULTISPECIES: hypothetical protein [Providencia]MDO7831655.1 hypothetical protein [Providencia sp. CRE-138-0026]MDO7858144.1 hypothetical protein [Providencia sp. CRE-138-0111]